MNRHYAVLSRLHACSALQLTAIVALASGCSALFSPRFETASSPPTDRRKPDGVAIDRDSAIPSARSTGSTTDVLLPLKEPVDLSEAMQPVRVFFRAVAAEDMDLLLTVLDEAAEQVNLEADTKASSKQHWLRRFEKFEYAPFAVAPPYRESMVETYRFSDLDELMPGRPSRPSGMEPHDVLIRVPIAQTTYGYEHMFGDEILFLVRRNGLAIQIFTVFEDFKIP